MQETIRCIVLRTVKYGDNSLIVDTYTESHGRMSFLTKISRVRRSGPGAAFWSQLSQVEFQTEIRNHDRLSKPLGMTFYYSYSDLPYNPLKSSIAMFICEFLCGALKGEQKNIPLYKYIETSLQWLDLTGKTAHAAGIANFHLVFLMRMTRFLGIYPNLECSDGRYFDLIAGEYADSRPSHGHYLNPDEAKLMPLLFRMDYATMHLYLFNRQQRQRCLEVLTDYYRIHIPQFPQLRSLDVLAAVFS